MAESTRACHGIDALVLHPGIVGVTGQVVYSWMLGNRVYFLLNACLVVTNSLGLAMAIHRRGIHDSHPQRETLGLHGTPAEG